MTRADVVVATMTLARDAEEAALIHGALRTLARLGMPIVAVDGGSPPEFVTALRGLPGVHVYVLEDPRGLVPQVTRSLALARDFRRARVLYTEPDKALFFASHVETFVDAAVATQDAGVVLASRSAEAFATFPASQQRAEAMASALCRDLTHVDADFLYGPFVLDTALVADVEALPAELGWGWRTFLFALARARGHRIAAIEGEYGCPPEQRGDGPAQRALRLTQLSQNVAGLALAVRRTLPGAHG